ncbi:hypothetical protein EN813_044845 [Mesorhizobium sp. M00.F.Ca.ET.170.01.1.1]|nr:hypothetical protein EN813_044845 [Mesorhizobium sp. M00.F.Ca.ET.170.01.1.1]
MKLVCYPEERKLMQYTASPDHNLPKVRRRAHSAAHASTSFKDTTARLAAGVAVVACVEFGIPNGIFFSSLPPLLTDTASGLFCIRNAVYSPEALSRSDHRSIAIISDADQIEAERFSRAERFSERFDPSTWTQECGQLAENALISIIGSIASRVDAGASIRRRAADLLVYFDRRYHALKV